MDTILGCGLIVAALVLITCLTLWSRRSIDRIASMGFGTIRQIRGEKEGGG